MIAIISAVVAPPALTSGNLAAVLQVFAVAAGASALIPLSLLTVELRRRLAELTTAERLLNFATPVSVDRVRTGLRAVLKDPTLEVYYWVPEQDCYVDVKGRPVDIAYDGELTVPPAGSTRWVRAVDTSKGQPLAIIVAEPALKRHQRLVDTALSVGSVALEQAQLQAELQAHVARIHAAQARIVEAEVNERKRVERDLHDGIQQRLVGLAMSLGALETTTADLAAGSVIDEVRKGLLDALAELRDLARGIHPAELSQRGLGPALEVVSERLLLPIKLIVPQRRFPAAIESTAYFGVCEALTNAAKHAQASAVQVRAYVEGGALIAEVIDDGIGGAQVSSGGGLAGIADRVHALGGTLQIISPAGMGTTVQVSIPCE
jgi:signal transduction histidine kinase